MKQPNSLKTIALSLGLAAMGLTAGNLNAQTGGGLFGRGAESWTDASNESFMRASGGIGTGFNIGVEQFGGENGGGQGGFNIGTEQFGDETPLGSGLFIMAAAGAAYAFSKKRKKQENN